MNHKEYNGWTNYETWVVNLWMDNSAGVQDGWIEQAAEILQSEFTPAYPSQTREDWAKYQLSEQIKAEHEENNPCCQFANCYSDLMNAALSEVNWYEIAEHFIDKAQQRQAA